MFLFRKNIGSKFYYFYTEVDTYIYLYLNCSYYKNLRKFFLI